MTRWTYLGTLLISFIGFPGPAAAVAQDLPQTPAPEIRTPDACPSAIRVRYDVSSIPEADRVRWQVWKGQGPTPEGPGFERVKVQTATGASGAFRQDLWRLGPIHDGTTYFVRIRAHQGNENVGRWSEYVAAPAAVLSPDGMFELTAGEGFAIDLAWSLTGDLGACADMIAYKVWKEIGQTLSTRASVLGPTASLPAIQPRVSPTPGAVSLLERAPLIEGTASKPSTPKMIDVSAHGAGEYRVRFAARRDGQSVGVWSAPSAVRVSAATASLVVQVGDRRRGVCDGSPLQGVQVTILESGQQVLPTSATDAQGRAEFTLPSGKSYAVRIEGPQPRCPGTTENVTLNGDLVREIDLDCAPDGDLRVRLEPRSDPAPLQPYELNAVVEHVAGGYVQMASLVVDREDAAKNRVEILSAGDPKASRIDFCPGDSRTIIARDESPGAGVTYVYRAHATPDTGNDTAERTVSFPLPTVAGQLTITTPPRIDEFEIQFAEARPGQSLPLRVTHSGATPTQYRVSESQSFAGADWQPYVISQQTDTRSSIGAYTWRPVYSFPPDTPSGLKTLYLQLRSAQGQLSNIARDDVQYFAEALPDPRIVTQPVLHSFATTERIRELLSYAESHGYGFREDHEDGDGVCHSRVHPNDVEPTEADIIGDPPDVGNGAFYVAQGRNSPAPIVSTSGSQICHFHFLQARRLAPGWRFLDVSLGAVQTQYADEGRSTALLYLPDSAQREAGITGFTLEIKHYGVMMAVIGPGTYVTAASTPSYTAVTLRGITLTGPGEDWRAAFP